jgi:hypothetical protein
LQNLGKWRSFWRSIGKNTGDGFQKTQEKSRIFEGSTSKGPQDFKSALSTYSNIAASGSIVSRFGGSVKRKCGGTV